MDGYFDLNAQTYEWCARWFSRVKSLLGVKIKLHHAHNQLEEGDIFLFNHFARAETFIPQYLIYQETGAYCRSVAGHALFTSSDRFGRLLRAVGAVPNNQPDLMLFLACDILRGRKIVVFPEGGMVKDRSVVDGKGRYSVYSGSAQQRRKHHTGAARLAVGLQIIKLALLEHHRLGHHAELEAWAEELEVASIAQLMAAARKPVTMVPANITFYPLRVQDNVLRRGAELFQRNLTERAIEELVVEGNLFLRTTDMDIRLGDPIVSQHQWNWHESLAARYLARQLDEAGAIFDNDFLNHGGLLRRGASNSLQRHIGHLRDRYMRAVYKGVTINASHLASRFILDAVERGRTELGLTELKIGVYRALKDLQHHKHVHLHRSLTNPTVYRALLDESSPELEEFLASAVHAGLLKFDAEVIKLDQKLRQEHAFHTVRLENPVEVYANETEPVADVAEVVRRAATKPAELEPLERAELAFDDELVSYEWDRVFFDKPRHHDINRRETATADARPFLLQPPEPRALGIVLVHGFLASPAEVRPFGDELEAEGFRVLGVRLKGHGTSPWDLRERTWSDWLVSVTRACDIMAAWHEQVAIVGFSTGGTLALLLASMSGPRIAGAAAVCAPIKFRNRNMRFVPLVHRASRVLKWISTYEGVTPFRVNDSEHPDINYAHVPIRGLFELTRLVSQVKDALPQVEVPVCIVQSDADHVVDPASAKIAYDLVGSAQKELHWVESDRHGILNEDVGQTRGLLHDYLRRLDRGDYAPGIPGEADVA